jgi:hypothetical protein
MRVLTEGRFSAAGQAEEGLDKAELTSWEHNDIVVLWLSRS